MSEMKPMRLGLLTGEFPPMQGGVGAYTLALAEALNADGHQVMVLTHREARPDDAPRRLAALREPLPMPWGELLARFRRFSWAEIGLIADAAIRYELDALVVQFQPAAFNMRNPALYFLPWRLRGVTPCVVTFHDLRVPYLFPKAGWLRRWVVERLARSADGVIATNAADFAALRRLNPHAVEIPIGSNIDARPVAPAAVAAVRAAYGIAPDTTLLGYFGFINESKGADALIEALDLLDDTTELLFIGGRTGASDADNNRAFLNQLTARIDALGLADRVHWTGFLAPDMVSAHLHAADMMVLPYRDGVSLRRGTLMAALAHGRPVITTAPENPIPALSHGASCWLVDSAEPTRLATAIKALAASPPLRAEIGARAAAEAKRFEWPEIARRIVAFVTPMV